VLASTPQEWFGVESIHDISDLDMLRWRCCLVAAHDFINPPPKAKK